MKSIYCKPMKGIKRLLISIALIFSGLSSYAQLGLVNDTVSLNTPGFVDFSAIANDVVTNGAIDTLVFIPSTGITLVTPFTLHRFTENTPRLDSVRIEYAVTDTAGIQDTAQVLFVLTPLLSANPDTSITVDGLSCVSFDVTVNDTVLSSPPPLVTIADSGLLTSGVSSSLFTYCDTANSSGRDTLEYVIIDATGNSDTSFVVITINPVPSDTVWPGDANDNGIVDQVDLLTIGWGVDTNAFARIAPSLAFTPQPVRDWGFALTAAATAAHHADADGNGVVQLADTLAVNQNYLEVHSGPQPFPPSSLPFELEIRFVNDSITAGDTLRADVFMVDTVRDVHGIAFQVLYDSVVTGQFTAWEFAPASPVSATDPQAIKFRRHLPGLKRYDIADSRTDLQSGIGSGYVGSVAIEIDEVIVQGIEDLNRDSFELALNYNVALDANGTFYSAQSNVVKVPVYQSPPPCDFIASLAVDPTTMGRCNGTVIAYPEGSMGPFTYVWSSGARGAVASDLCEGWVSVEITDAMDCSILDSAFVGLEINQSISGLEGVFFGPNPVDSRCLVRLEHTSLMEWVVVNSLGQVVDRRQFNQPQRQTVIPTGHWPRGVYTVLLHQQNGRLQKIPLLKK